MLIKDILSINLEDDIKNVIDLEDLTDAAILSEIDHYIITDGLAHEYNEFVSVFTSNIVETGVWLSGFYGSGKSYFGKLLGYMLSNQMIGGTPARDRIIEKFSGVENEELIKNTIARLNSVKTRVVFLDIARQDTSKGFAYALFRNFMKSLELPENEHGLLLYSLMCGDGYGATQKYIQDKLGQAWKEIKHNRTLYIKQIKELSLGHGQSEADYTNLLTTIRREIDEFDSAKLKTELENYLNVVRDEKIVFLFDEASEAINQGKFTLLDLQGLSESLSSLGGKVWTIAIAQEKLDDVISNSNVSRAQLNKVTDRFKTKIHLEATEVDVIIRSRLLRKNETGINRLKEHYQNHSGKIAEHSSLTGAGKTESEDSYVTYYPFYQNQFGLLQNFLFGKQGVTSTRVAARGMIITTYEILKLALQRENLFQTATVWQILREAMPQPAARLVNRFSSAEQILRNERVELSGRALLETIHFFSEAEIVQATHSNLLKAFVKSPEDIMRSSDMMTKALDVLVEHKILLVSNGTYRITSDVEQRLLDEMNQYPVPVFKKKSQIIESFKNSNFVQNLARLTDGNDSFDFFISADNDESLTNPSRKQLKIKIKSIYSFGEDRGMEIEALRSRHQNEKELIWIAPENKYYRDIDRLLEEIERIKYLEERYTNPNSEEGFIVRSFQAERSAKESRLKDLAQQSLVEGVAIYLFNTFQLNREQWHTTINGIQRQMIQNMFSQRLSAQLPDTMAERVIREGNAQRLHTYFNGQPPEFQFFDNQGNFVGESLKTAEQILHIIRNTYVDGATLERDLEIPPTGFSIGTIMTTTAALMRGGKIIAKYNGFDKFSWKDDGVPIFFQNSREFRRASFKAVSRTLSTAQKNSMVGALQELNISEHIGQRVDWNTNDYELVSAVRELAKRFCDKVDDMKRQTRDFEVMFAYLESAKDLLGGFTGAVSESNYIERAENYLDHIESYAQAVQTISDAEKFMRLNLEKVRKWKVFADGVRDELNKAAQVVPEITVLTNQFSELYSGGVVKNFTDLQNRIQKIKDAYYQLMLQAASEMSARYLDIQKEIDAVGAEIASLPSGINEQAEVQLNSIRQYVIQRTNAHVRIDFDVMDTQSRFTYSEMLSFVELANTKKTDIKLIQAGLLRSIPPETGTSSPASGVPRLYTSQVPGRRIRVSVYKMWLQEELHKLASAAPEDEIEIKPNT